MTPWIGAAGRGCNRDGPHANTAPARHARDRGNSPDDAAASLPATAAYSLCDTPASHRSAAADDASRDGKALRNRGTGDEGALAATPRHTTRRPHLHPMATPPPTRRPLPGRKEEEQSVEKGGRRSYRLPAAQNHRPIGQVRPESEWPPQGGSLAAGKTILIRCPSSKLAPNPTRIAACEEPPCRSSFAAGKTILR